MTATTDSEPRAGRSVLDALYARVLAAADAAHAHRGLVAACGLPLVTLLIVTINQLVLLDFPNSGDEYVYLYQAQTLAAGRLWNASLAPSEVFGFTYVVHEPGRAFGSFPFGWPLILAIGLRVGLPAWLVNPLLGALTLVLVWALGARLYGHRTGVLATLVVGASPFFLFNAASYFSHTACGVLLLSAGWLASRPDRTPPWVPLAIGMLIGWAVVTRYFTGALCGVPIVWWLLQPGVHRPRTLALVIAGGLPWVLTLAAYNEALTGSPWQLTTQTVTFSRWFADGFALRGVDILATHVLRHLVWSPPALLVLYVVMLRHSPAEMRRGLEWLLALTAGVLFFYMERGGNQYGPRFHYEALLFAVPFVVANVVRHPRLAPPGAPGRWPFAALAASVLLMPAVLAAHAVNERGVILERMDVYADVRAAGLRRAVVLVSGRVGSERSMAAGDLTRNGIDYAADVLYGQDPGAARRCVDARLPGRTLYLYDWDVAADDGALRRVTCPSTAPAPAPAIPPALPPVLPSSPRRG